MSPTWSLVIALAAPLVLSPLIVLGTRPLFAKFLREGAELFSGAMPHRELAHDAASTIALINVVLFTLAWWGAVGLRTAELSMITVVVPFLAALPLGLYLTRVEVKARLHLLPKDSWLVGLLTFAGGNLPLILTTPVILMLVPMG